MVNRLLYTRRVNGLRFRWRAIVAGLFALLSALSAVAIPPVSPGAMPPHPAVPRVFREGVFSVYHAGEDAALAERIGHWLTQATKELEPILPIGPDLVTVILAPDINVFMFFARNWRAGQVVGLASPDKGLIVLMSPRNRPAGDDLKATVMHELTHVLLARNTRDEYLPRWLNEGVAMLVSGEYFIASPITVGRMFLENRMIPYRDLNFAFLNPGEEMVFNDAYAQALSMTRFLRRRLGEDRFWQVVRHTRDMPFADALREYGGLTVLEFWDAYRRSLWVVAVVGILASGSLFGPIALLSLLTWWRIRRRNQRVIERWEEEERAEQEDRSRGLPPIMSWEEAMNDPDAYIPGIDDEED
ncbi:MAG TPA: hypothetical protein PLH06_13490 [Candidatus Hydrogenedentes bacterium]|nr:hypothetical protein [Candidatus Hydrogenedentota bacterium]